MKKSISIVATLSLLVMLGCTQPVQEEVVDYTADKEALTKVMDDYIVEMLAGNVDAAVDGYQVDGICIMPQGAIEGHEALREFFTDFFENNQYTKYDYTIEDIKVGGDLAVIRMSISITITPKDGSDPVNMDTQIAVVYDRQIDGSWKGAFAI